METVESAGLLKKAVDLLFKGLDNVFRDFDSKPVNKSGKLGNVYVLTLPDHPDAKIGVYVYPVKDHKDLYYVEDVVGKGKLDNGSPIKFKTKWEPQTLDGEEILKELQKFLEDNDLGTIGKLSEEPDESGDFEEEESEKTNTESSSKVCAKLRKIQGSEDIEYIAINATCDPVHAMDMLCDVLDSGEICVADEPLSIEILDQPDGYEVSEIEDVVTENTPCDFFSKAVELKDNIECIRRAVVDPRLDVINLWIFSEIVGEAAKFCIRMSGVYPNEGTAGCDFVVLDNPVDGDTAFKMIADEIQKFLDFAELYVVNFDAADQENINHWISELRQIKDITIATATQTSGPSLIPLAVQTSL